MIWAKQSRQLVWGCTAALGLAAAAHAGLLTREDTSMAGKPAPAIEGKGVLDGAEVKTAAAAGKPLLVIFFCSWCPPSKKELADLKALRAKVPAERLMIVGVAMDPVRTPATVSQVKPSLEKAALGFPVVMATEEMIKSFNCPGWPATYVINPEGKFVKALFGYHPPTKLAAEVNALLPQSTSR
jgi:thiol-disulfide isomerase/thioredoxin